MSRRLLNHNDLGVSSSSLPVENPIELVMNKPKPVQNYVPSEPIILTKEQWQFVCNKTHDASIPFKVEVTVTDTTHEGIFPQGNTTNEEEDEEGVDQVKDEETYVPKRTRKSRK